MSNLDTIIDEVTGTTNSPLDAAIDEVTADEKEARRRALLSTGDRSPDELAEAKRVGKVLNLPTAAAAADLPEQRKRARLDEIDSLIEGAPVLARKLGEPEFAGVARDDVESLANLETTLGTPGDPMKSRSFFEALWSAIPSSKDGRVHYSAGNRAARAMARDQQPLTDQPEQAGALRFNRETGRLERQGNVLALASEVAGAFGDLPQNTLATVEGLLATEAGDVLTSPYLRQRLERAKAKAAGGVDTLYDFKLGTIPSGIESLPFSLFSTVAYLSASVPVGVATKNPVAAHTAGMAFSFAFAYRADRGRLWNELYPVANAAFRLHTGLQRDMLPEEFTVFAEHPAVAAEVRKHALAEAGFEALGNLVTVRSFSKALSSTAAKTLTAETVSRHPWILAGVKSVVGELATETPTEIAQGRAETALGIRKGPAPEWTSAADWREAFSDVFWPTLVTMGAIGGGAKVVEATGIAERWFEREGQADRANMAADVFARLFELNKASKVLSRDAESLQQFIAEVAEDGPVQDVWVSPSTLMQSGVDVQALAQVSPSFAEQLDDALQNGGEVRVPVAELTTTLPNTGFEQAIIPHLRTDPDSLTQAEAQAFMQSQVEEFQREAEGVLAKVEEGSAFDTSAQVVEDNIFSQLSTANRFTADVNREYAKIARAVFSSTAARMKVTPEEAYKQFALQVRAQQIAAQYDQKTRQLRTETPEFKAWFGDSKVVDAAGKPLVVYHGTRNPPTAFSEFRTGGASTVFGSYEVERYGIFAAEDSALSAEYATQGERRSGSTTMPLYLRAERPLDTLRADYTSELFSAVEKAAEKLGAPNGHYAARMLGGRWERGTLWTLFDADEGNDPKFWIDLFKSLGYDSLRIEERSEGGATNTASWVVFSPTQIKSVFNRGTFDPNDPNILAQSAFKEVTEGTQALVDQRTPELIEEYFARFGNVIDPDNVKQLFPAYATNPALAAAVHEPSSQLTKAVFTEALRRNRGAPVVFTAGGGGSGKTEAMSVTQALLGGPEAGGIIYDSTLSSFESAVRKIDEALASGSEVEIVYTNRMVEDAFVLATGRARVVPISVLAQAHVGASNTIRQLTEHYAGDPRVQIQVVNNFGEVDDINLGSLADVPTYEYDVVERRLHGLARGALEAGRISEERYAALAAPARGALEVSAGEVQGGEQGQDLGGLVEGLDALFQSSVQQPAVSSSKVASLDEFDTNMPAFLRKDGWIVITATASGDPYSEANVEANRVLEEDLKARGLPYKAGEGFYLKGPQGTSFLVLGDEALGIDLAKKYKQESVLTKDGYVYQDGSLTPVDHTKDTFGDEAKQQDGYTVIDDKAFSLGLDFSQRVRPMDRPQPSLPFAVRGVKAIHYSKVERKTLDGRRFGEGLTGAERERLRDADPRLRVRTAFYVSNGRGVFPEAGVGSVAHLSTLNNLYDADADPLHIWDKHRDANARELAVIEAGYAGYLGRDTFDRQGTAVVFGRSDLATSKVEDANAVAEVPSPPNISEVQRVRRAFATDRRFPAGQMARSAWGAYARTIEPSYYDKLAPFGVFEGEDVVYRDELLREVYGQTLSETEKQQTPFDKARLPELRRRALGLESPEKGLFLRITEEGEAIATGPKGARVPRRFIQFAVDNGLKFLARRRLPSPGSRSLVNINHIESRYSLPLPISYREAGALYFSEMGDAWLDRTESRVFQGETAPRGQFEPSTNTITLLQQADLTTFIHELGHFQLEVLANLATQGDATARRDMQVLLNWFGVPDLATWNGFTLEEKRPYHEQLARGFEAYMLEGRAPTLELQSTFSRIRAWMLNIYRQLSQLNVTLTNEVRGVFDRMLATDQQIADAQAQRGFAAMFDSAEAAGMTPEEWAAYQQLGAQATEDATVELQARSLRNMRWLSNFKSRALKAAQKDADAKRKATEAEVREEVRKRPVYAARRFLAYGELGPEVLFAKGEELAGKLDLGALKAMYGEGPAAPWRYLPTGENGLAASEGLHPDLVAELFGFTSGDHLVRELIGADQEAVVIEGLTDQRMLERYGDLTTPEAIERAAEKAIHNEARVRFIATELNALARATGSQRALLPAAREFAARTIARQLIRKLKPTQYAAAEARAGRAAVAALKAGNTTEAAVEKRNQLVNSLTAKAATEAAADIESAIVYLKKFDREGTRKKIDIDYLDQIDAILERFDLRTGQSLTAIDKRKSLANWIAQQEAMGLEPAIPDELRNEAFRKHYKDLTVEEFRGLVDSVRNIEHLGRLKTKLLTAVRQREFAAAVEEIVISIEANAKGTVGERRSSDRGRLVNLAQLGRNFLADHRKFASLAREMDGWQDGGVVWEYLVRTMNAAGDKEAAMREQATVKLTELLKPILKEGGMGRKTYFPAIGKSFTREERIGIALNVGNEINRERVLSGEKLSPVQLQSILDTLTKPEMDFVQGVWDFFESYRPQIADKQRRLTGTEPEWVQPTPVSTKFGEYKGGYYPITYDPLRSSRAEADTAAEVQRQIERGLYVQAQTRRGHLKARVDSTGRPLRYDLGVIVKHVDQVVHDLAWHEFLIDANRLLRNGRVDSAIREHYGPEKLATMKDTLRDIAIGDMAAQGSLDHILTHLRHGATIVGLGWRVTTSLLQPLGLTQSMVRIGPRWVVRGLRHWAGDAARLENSVRLVGEKSTFMRLRAKTLQREINEIRNQVRGEDSRLEASYFWLIQKMQLIADLPTWWGAYEKAMAEEEEEEDATEERAIALADQAVLDAQGSGQIKDLSGVQRGGAGWKLFTTFYSFFNTTYQLTTEAIGRTSFKSPTSVALLGIDLLLLYTIPAILGTLMKAALSGDWDDDEKLLRRLLADQVGYLTGTMVLVREGGGLAQNVIDPQHAFDYQGPASLRFMASVSKLAKQVGQGEPDEAFWRALNETGGTLFHYPAGQINATLDGVNAMAEGRTENPGALIVGHRD